MLCHNSAGISDTLKSHTVQPHVGPYQCWYIWHVSIQPQPPMVNLLATQTVSIIDLACRNDAGNSTTHAALGPWSQSAKSALTARLHRTESGSRSCQVYLSHSSSTWAAQYNTWLLIELTPKSEEKKILLCLFCYLLSCLVLSSVLLTQQNWRRQTAQDM